MAIDAQSAHDDMASDGGWRSRKFWGFVITAAIIGGSAVLGCFHKFAAFDLSAVIEGEIVLYGLMIGANVTTKFAAAGIAKTAINAGCDSSTPAKTV